MNILHIDQPFAKDYKTSVESMPNGSAKTRAMRNAHRLKIMAETGQEFFEVLLDEDREPTAFDSNGLYQTIHRLDVDDQKRLQLGMQMMNMFDEFSGGVLIGGYAKAHYTDIQLSLKPQMTFVIAKYERLMKYCSTEGINTIVSPDKTFFEIPSHGAKIYDGNSNPIFADILSGMQYARIFSGKVALSSRPELFEIN